MIDLDTLIGGKNLFLKYYLKYHNAFSAFGAEFEKNPAGIKYTDKSVFPVRFDLVEIFTKEGGYIYPFEFKDSQGRKKNFRKHYFNADDDYTGTEIFESGECIYTYFVIKNGADTVIVGFDKYHFAEEFYVLQKTDDLTLNIIYGRFDKYRGFLMKYSECLFVEDKKLMSMITVFNRVISDCTYKSSYEHDYFIEKLSESNDLLTMPHTFSETEPIYKDGIVTKIIYSERFFSDDSLRKEFVTLISGDYRESFTAAIKGLADLCGIE